MEHPRGTFQFGRFRLDLSDRRLTSDGEEIYLRPKTYDTLLYLVERPGHLVTKNDLLDAVWEGVEVSENALTRCIKEVRAALGDEVENPHFIRTVPRLGYEFIADVDLLAGHESRDRAVGQPEAPQLVGNEGDTGLRFGKPSADRNSAATPAPGALSRLRLPGNLRRAIIWLAAAVFVLVAVSIGLNLGGLRGRLLPNAGASHGVPLPKIRSIAVLPLENLSGDPQQEYFADGMTDELIMDLGKISALRVISRTSVMRYKRTKKPLPEIGRELHVDAIVEGTVRRSGGRVRITANLLDAPADRHLWTQAYERDLGDVLVLQSEVAHAIASQIRIKLTPQEQLRLATTHPVNPEAYRLCLLGRFYWNKRNEEGLTKANEQFQRAVEIDPTYAPAYAGLADSYLQLANDGVRSPKETIPKAKAAAQKALEIDPSLAQAHTSLAEIYLDYDWNWAASEREFKRAIELNPNYATAHQWYAEYLSAMRRHAEAIAEAQHAEQLDPLSPIIQVGTASMGGYLFARQYDEAIRHLRDTVSLFPDFENAYWALGDACEAKGMYKEAFAAYQKAELLRGTSPDEMAALGKAYAKKGMRGYYLWNIEKLRKESKHRYVRPYYFAGSYLAVGEKDQASSFLEKAYEDRDCELNTLQVNPLFDPLRSDPRFQDLVRRMNFPP